MENKPRVRKHIDHYVVFDEKLGQGQFSTVYKAMDKNSQNHQSYKAIKQIPLNKLNLTQQPHQKELLQKEIDILLKARHPNLIQLHDMKQSPNNLYLMLDYCNGGDLKSYMIKKGGRLSEHQAVQFFKELCAGYKVLHQQNIIHRDIKPENILLHNGHVKIGDFGFARIVNGDMNDAVRMTQKCSPLYAPPQLLLNQNYSSKCDVFSMGATFFEMLYGQTPFIASTVSGLEQDQRSKLVNKQLEFPSNVVVAMVVKDLISKMLQYEEKDRISWEEVFQHEIHDYTPTGLIDFELEEGGNPLTKSIEKARTSLTKHNYKQYLQEDKLAQEMNIEDSQNMCSQITEPQSFPMENEDDMYGNFMYQIKQREQQDSVLKKIDAYIHFIKNRALYTNATLINFWNSFQNYNNIKPYIKCQVLISLSGYHYFNLLTLKKLIYNETQQTIFKQDTFNQYLNSQFCQDSQQQINEIAQNAEILHKELEPLCMKEFSNSLSGNKLTEQEKCSLQQFVQVINQPQVNYEIFVKSFINIIPGVFQSLDLYSQDLDLKSTQSLYMILIFANMDLFFPSQKYLDFDFQLFEDNNLRNLNQQQLQECIKQTLIKCHNVQI